MRKLLLIGAVAPVCAVASLSFGQVITTLVKAGDPVAGVGNASSIGNLAVNNSGDWLLEIDTDAATAADLVLVKGGSLLLREGQSLPGVPAGSVTLSSFDAVNYNNAGVFAGNIFLNGATTSTDSGVYQNSNLVMQESTISIAPEFSANTPYVGWFETKLNNSGQKLVMASVDDPAITSTVDRAIVLWNVGPTGTLLSEKVLAKEGDILPGHTQAAADFGTGPHDFDFNDAGVAMFSVDGAGATADDFALYVGDTKVAQESGPSPVAGRTWGTAGLGSSRVALNNTGGHAYTGTLDSSNTADDLVIIRNNNKFIQEGDTLPAIGGVFTFTAFGSGPIDLDDNGNLLWFGDWNDTDTTKDTGLFLNDQLLVQEGVTQIDGMTVFSISGVEDGFRISDNGAFVIFEATLAGTAGNLNGAFMIAIPEPASLSLLALGGLALRRRR